VSAIPDSPLASGPEPTRWYAAFQQTQGFQPDPAQETAVERLQALHDALVIFKGRSRGLLARTLLWADQSPPRGIYLYGGVGRGKSALMDAFFAGLPYRRKRRVHFHPFMREVHEALRQHVNEADPLTSVAAEIARATRVLCFDEFHVSDIADAMILSRLLETLFARGVVLVVTSNYAPAGLYPEGLQRERFLPAIALLERQLDVLCVDGGVDHRRRALEREPVFFTPLDAAAESALAALYRRTTGQGPRDGEIEILGRRLRYRGHASGVIWFDFDALCGGPRSQLDYLKLAESHALLMLSGVPLMTPAMAAEARRFTWLIDILYDHHVPIALSAAAALDQLYPEGRLSGEFVRTVSRLEEMQSLSWRQAAASA
jgi:cell division protein ZapE